MWLLIINFNRKRDTKLASYSPEGYKRRGIKIRLNKNQKGERRGTEIRLTKLGKVRGEETKFTHKTE